MSLRAILWAFDQQVFPLSTRFVLVALANYSTDTGKSYPGIESICEITGGNRKTIISALQKLQDMGVITDTGKRTGYGGKIKVYQLPPEAYSKSPKNGTLETTPRVPQESSESPVRVPKTVLFIGTGNKEQGTLPLNPPRGGNGSVENELVTYWNSKPDFCHVQILSSGRSKALRVRLKEDHFRENWKEAINRAAQSSFCCGQNSRGWKADLDWFLRPDTVAKILEGKYDNRTPGPVPTKSSTARDVERTMERAREDGLI